MKILKTKAFLVLVVFGLFTFQSCKKPLPTVLPSVTLGPITEITDVSAKVEINVISDGRGSVSDAGVKINSTGCANCSGNFTFVTSTRMGKSVINLTGLKKATTYNILAFVTNEIGTYNTVEITFSTSATAPIIKDDTNVISLIKATTAKVGNFQILDDGGATAFYSGICWSTNPNPTIADFKTRDTILNKAYLGLNSSLLNLKANTKYYIRPYAINTVGVGYGKELSFTTDPNNSCQPNAIEPESSVMQILPVGNDKFMLIGQFRNINGLENFNAALFNNDGSFDNNFAAIASDYGYNYFQLNNSTYLSNGKVIIYARNLITSKSTIIRLNPNGKLDDSFKIPAGTSTGTIVKMFALPDGKTILVGRFTEFNGATVNKVVKLNVDGTVDGSFALSSTFNLGTVYNAAMMNNGNIVIQSLLSNGYQNFVLKTDGTFDTSTPLHNSITQNLIISVLKNNQFICSNGVPAITRMNVDGTNDNSFNNIKITPSPTASSTYLIKELSDSKLLVGVNSSLNSQSVFTIYRLNSNGTADATFGANGSGGLEFRNGTLFALTMSGDGKILVGGNFTQFMDRTARYFIKLNANGSFCN